MIIDIHGHYTTAPEAHNQWRIDQLAAFAAGQPSPPYPEISDDTIRASIEENQLKLITERGSDLTTFSPRPSAMGHHEGDQRISLEWTVACNNLIKRVVDLFPDTFVGVGQLPQSPGADLTETIAELERVVNELGFIGVNLNPDPSGGLWQTVPLTDTFWYPLYEKMVELDVPAMVHVSASCNPNFHATGAHYMNADTTAFMQLIQGDLFADRTPAPTMRANQLRLWLASFAYVLMCAVRRIGLAGTKLAAATCGTIRLKLLKIGARVTISVRRVKLALATACPDREVFMLAARRL